jgi:hypothetical protein
VGNNGFTIDALPSGSCWCDDVDGTPEPCRIVATRISEWPTILQSSISRFICTWRRSLVGRQQKNIIIIPRNRNETPKGRTQYDGCLLVNLFRCPVCCCAKNALAR